MVEEKKEKPEGKAITIKIPKFNLWILVSLVLALALVLSLVRGWSITGKVTGVLSGEEAGNKVIEWLTNYYDANGLSISFKLLNTTEIGGIYKLSLEATSSQGKEVITYYATKDGKFIPNLIDTSEKIEKPAAATPTEIPKTDKPVAQLFVMSFCPYGIQAENSMKPVVDLLGSKVAIEPHFIVTIEGTTVNSLHGEYEANEDMRQACIWKYYGQTTFWKYVTYLNSNCNKNNLDTCWKDAAKNASVDSTKIETCATNDGLTLMKAEEQLSGKNSVSGSPTLIINGALYNGARTPEAYKQAICSGFNTPPSECNQNLTSTSTGTAASGGCG
jgi:hypothetical protein